jgi:parallel beta-helix repeat protein
MFSKMLAGALGASIVALGVATSAQAATITVNDSGNSGSGTLRDAINTANNTPAVADTIKFKIPGSGVHTIRPLTPLPTLTSPVTINGYTQTDADPATDVSPATLKIVIDGGDVDDALRIESGGVTVKGLNVQGAREEGVHVEGRNNTIAGNYIGTGVNGAAARPNDLEGVRVVGDGNTIGGPNPADRNLISANGFAEVLVEEGGENTVQNNYIGLDADGEIALGDRAGVQLMSSDNTVRDNLISGEAFGIEVSTDNNVVQGNKVGTNAAGTSAVPNSVGVSIVGGDGNVIGGEGEGERNVLSGNEHNGVELNAFGATDPAEHNEVKGNLIGTTAAGNVKLPNGEAGVSVSESDNNTIGGTAADAANVISGNTGPGVELVDATGNKVLGNSIGTDETRALDLGNDGPGVEIDGVNNRVGDMTGGANTIAHNGEDGVTVDAGTGNAVLRNSIHTNAEQAIDNGADGPTANDTNDTDPGANDLQNGAEIDSASATEVTWSLDTDPTTRYRLEFYANDTCSAASVTEAQTFLGSTVITTDANGNADDSTPITLPAGAGPFVSMTATRLQLAIVGGGFPPPFALEPRSTSEVSPCEEIA